MQPHNQTSLIGNEVKDTEISLFNNCKAINSTTITLDALFDFIRTGKGFKVKIEQLRATTNPTERDALKQSLPAVTVSGLFSNARKLENLIAYPGLLQIDLDKVENILEARKKLLEDKYVFALFFSPTGTGLKIIFRIENNLANHLKSFLAVEKYFLDKYGLQIDNKCKDVTRLMFLSHDENLFVNKNATVFLIQNNSEEKYFDEALNYLSKTENFNTGNRNNFVFKLACQCRNKGISKGFALNKIIEKFRENDFTEKEIITAVESAYNYPQINNFKKKGNTPIAEKILNVHDKNNDIPLFKIKPANEWIDEAKSKPIPKMLFSEFWHQGELCFLFSDTNLGKSILAVQIADAISKGETDTIFKVEVKKEKVLYFDFELGEKQFEKRYSKEYKDHYRFDENFIRIEINPDYSAINDFESDLYAAIEKAVIEQQAKILIIDNITYLKTQSTDTAKEALPLMNTLIKLKKKYGLSILALAHTPKRNQTIPITINDLAGSKHLSNFADSIFTIGLSHKASHLRYIKQIKARATEMFYDSDYVIVCEVDKPDNFLQFNYVEFGHEREHLKQLSDTEHAKIDNDIVELYKSDNTLSERAIARQLNINHRKVSRVLKRNGLKA